MVIIRGDAVSHVNFNFSLLGKLSNIASNLMTTLKSKERKVIEDFINKSVSKDTYGHFGKMESKTVEFNGINYDWDFHVYKNQYFKEI